MGFFRVLIYGIMMGVYAGALIYDVRFMPRVVGSWWVQKLIMLTVLNLTLQTVYSVICFLCSVFDFNEEIVHAKEIKHAHIPSYWYERKTLVHKICDFMYSTSVFPVGIVTCVLFWTLYLADPALVHYNYGTLVIPKWYNHITHTAPLGFLLVDTILTCHRAPSRKVGSFVVIGLTAIYTGILLGIRFTEGYWLYPLFNALRTEQIALLFAIGWVTFWFVYLIGEGLNAMIWGKAPHSVETPRPKGKKRE